MAFDNVPFPLPLTALRARPRWSDTVVELGGGAEQRTNWWSDYRRVYNALTGIRSLADWVTIDRHFNARRARTRCFPLLDKTAFQCTLEAFGTGTGGSAAYQLVRAEGDSGNAYSRPIRKPINGTVTVYDGATPISFSLDYATGIVTCTGGSGHVLSWTGQFYTVVRYDFSEMPPPELFLFRSADGTGLVNGPDLPMIETRDFV